jgi:hypothetical protein
MRMRCTGEGKQESTNSYFYLYFQNTDPSLIVSLGTGCRSAMMLSTKRSFYTLGHDKLDDISVHLSK